MTGARPDAVRKTGETAFLEPARQRLAKDYDRVRDMYGKAVGRSIRDVVTPSLALDLPAASRNVTGMATAMADMPTDLRPHIKVHKSPDLAQLQIDAGAIGLSVATAWEAVVMAAAGFDDLLSSIR